MKTFTPKDVSWTKDQIANQLNYLIGDDMVEAEKITDEQAQQFVEKWFHTSDHCDACSDGQVEMFADFISDELKIKDWQ